MAARKFKASWWCDFQIAGIRYRKRSPENTRMGAEAFEAHLRQRLAHGEDIIAKPVDRSMYFKAFAAKWFTTMVKTENKPSEVRTKTSILNNHLYPYFGDLPLNKIDNQLVERYKALKVKQGLSAKTVNNHLTVLKRCLRVAVEWQHADNVPKISPLKTTSRRLDFLLPVESKRLIQAANEPIWREMILVALRTGMRFGELCGLEWRDIDFERKMITVSRSIVRGLVGTPKNNKIRYIPLTDEVCRAIYEHRRPSGLVFQRGDGKPLSAATAARAIARACIQAGIRRITWHTLRHTFASQLVSEGIALNVVQQLMGHSTVTMTMRYAHLAPSATREAVEVLERAEKRESASECQPAVNLEQMLTKLHS